LKRDLGSLQPPVGFPLSDFKSEYITAAMIQLTPAHQGAHTAHQGAQTALQGAQKPSRGLKQPSWPFFCFSFYRRLVLSVISSFSRLLSDLLPRRMVVNGGKVEHSLLWSCIREVFQGLALNDSAKKLTDCLFSVLKSCQETNKTH